MVPPAKACHPVGASCPSSNEPLGRTDWAKLLMHALQPNTVSAINRRLRHKNAAESRTGVPPVQRSAEIRRIERFGRGSLNSEVRGFPNPCSDWRANGAGETPALR